MLVGDEHVNGLSVMYEASAGIKEENKEKKRKERPITNVSGRKDLKRKISPR